MGINANHINIYWRTIISLNTIHFIRDIMYFMRNNPGQSVSQLWVSQRTEKDEAWLNSLEVNVTSQVRMIITTH